MFSSGFLVYNETKEKFKFIFCPSFSVGEETYWIWKSPRDAIAKSLHLKHMNFFVYTYDADRQYWYVIVEEAIEPGKYYLTSYGAYRPYINNIIPPRKKCKKRKEKRKKKSK